MGKNLKFHENKVNIIAGLAAHGQAVHAQGAGAKSGECDEGCEWGLR